MYKAFPSLCQAQKRKSNSAKATAQKQPVLRGFFHPHIPVRQQKQNPFVIFPFFCFRIKIIGRVSCCRMYCTLEEVTKAEFLDSLVSGYYNAASAKWERINAICAELFSRVVC
jgi:hypothetical protein